jgi:hypothetical protein
MKILSYLFVRDADLVQIQERDHDGRKQKRRKARARGRPSRRSRHSDIPQPASLASSHSHPYWQDQNTVALERKRNMLAQQWKTEHDSSRVENERSRWYQCFSQALCSEGRVVVESSMRAIAWTEEFFANLPLTIGAIALATATLGVDWFKFAEENLSTCEPVHFHSCK